MLHNRDRRQASREIGEHAPQRFHAAGRGSDDDQLAVVDSAGVGGGLHPGLRRLGGHRCLDDHRGRACRGAVSPGPRAAESHRRCRRLDVVGQLPGQGPDRHRAIGLGEDVDGAGLEGIEGHLRAGLGQGADHHHWHRMVLHQDPQEGQPIHPRHLEVERDHVGGEPHDLLAGYVGIAGRSHHLDPGVEIEAIGDRLPHECRIVDDEHAEFLLGRRDAHGRPGWKRSPRAGRGVVIRGACKRSGRSFADRAGGR